jgi:hypothetical protein
MSEQQALYLPDSPALTPELRKELMDLSAGLKAAAAKIDAMTGLKQKRELDVLGEPMFAFNAVVPIPKDFYITKILWQYAAVNGFKDEEIKSMADAFVRYYNKSGKKWKHWSKVWMDWVQRDKATRRDLKTRVSSDQLPKW